ncbi:MAG: hypothetical protein IT270_04815 [Saprospiraceae bacterium]|nr:hypothetical protein [Saprospiraceae bacterium]
MILNTRRCFLLCVIFSFVCFLRAQTGTVHMVLGEKAPLANVGIELRHPGKDACKATHKNPDTVYSGGDGIYRFSACPENRPFILRTLPPAVSDWAMGIDVYDMLCIQRHIHSITPLENPYAILAADVNDNQSVTTTDVAELNKILLGNDDAVSRNTPWQVFPQKYVFKDKFGLSDRIPDTLMTPGDADFVSIKKGDVDGSAHRSFATVEKRSVTTFSWYTPAVKAGEVVTFPVIYSGYQPIEAYQCGLRFDTRLLMWVGVSQGDLEGMSETFFGLKRLLQGEIRTTWLTDLTETEPGLKPDTKLFFLSFKVLQDIPENALLLWFDDNIIRNVAFDASNNEQRISYTPAMVPAPITSTLVRANCTLDNDMGDVRFQIDSQEALSVRIALFSAFGQMLWMQTAPLEKGSQNIVSPVLADKPSGIYLWKVWYPGLVMQEGRLVKI